MQKKNIHFLTQAAMIAALYVVLTFIANAFGLANYAVQVRFSEALTILPIFTTAGIPGLFIGCIISNVLTGCALPDIIFGSIADVYKRQTQYNSIMRLYEQRQTKNRHLRDERLHYVYTHVTGYQKLDESVATLSVAQGKKMLNGDPNALSELKESLHKLTNDKQRLLNAAGLPADYLEPIFDCPDCRDTGYVDGKKCHCFRQAEKMCIRDSF